jgi:hypothetical protein
MLQNPGVECNETVKACTSTSPHILPNMTVEVDMSLDLKL